MKFNLSELVKIVNGYAFKSADIISDQSAYVIKIKNIQSSKILLEKDSMTAEMDGLNKYQIKFNDILISLTGSGMNQMSSAVGKVGRFRHTQKAYLNQRVAKISSLDETKLTNDYLYYFINRPEIQKDLVSVATGSANQVNISPKIIGELSIDLPDLAEQERITNILTAFDSKIEILESINDNLLDLSMTHFERWLETTPSTNNVSLDEIATYKNGLAMQKFEPENDADSLPVLKIRELNQGFTDSSSNRARTDIDESVKVHDGDVIFSWSGTLLVDIWTGGPAGLNQHLFKVTSDAYPKWFYYMWTRYHLRQFQQIAAGKATTMGHIKRGDLKAANVIIPTDSEFVQLETLLKPVVDAYIENGVEIKSLQTIRDQLLQKLLG